MVPPFFVSFYGAAYRASVYFHADVELWSRPNHDDVGNSFGIGINSLYYVPLTETVEMVFGVGLLSRDIYALALPLAIGFNWHLDHVSLGFDLTYQPSCYVFSRGFLLVQDLSLNFVVGYTL